MRMERYVHTIVLKLRNCKNIYVRCTYTDINIKNNIHEISYKYKYHLKYSGVM